MPPCSHLGQQAVNAEILLVHRRLGTSASGLRRSSSARMLSWTAWVSPLTRYASVLRPLP